ncbi:MAG: ABC transporter permease [Bacteroidota bacterium]
MRQSGYSLINISGLALGLASCFLITLYIQFETSYEVFHKKADDIYRYIPRYKSDDGEVRMQTWTPPGFAPAMADHFAEIEKFTRFAVFEEEPLLKIGETVLPPEYLALGDQAFFDIFSIQLLRGASSEVLANPFSIVISENVANDFFPDEDPVGKVIRFDNSLDLTITGVFESIPNNSHLQFSYLVAFETLGYVVEAKYGYPKDKFLSDLDSWNYSAYFLMNPGVKAKQLEKRIDEYFTTLTGKNYNPDVLGDWLQPLDEIHFTENIRGDEATGNINNVRIFAVIAIFILVIACFNFTNLATARATKRIKEVGVRKAMGAQKFQLIYQFLGETFLLTSIALIFSVILIELTLPVFNSIMGLSLHTSYFDHHLNILVLIGIGSLTGIIAGVYPAFYLSSFRPSTVLKSDVGKSAKSTLRQVLIVSQFSIAAFLIIGSLIVSEQTSYMNSKSLGFDKDRIIYFSPPTSISNKMEVFKNNLKLNGSVLEVTQSNGVPGYTSSHWTYNIPGVDNSMNINTMIVDFNFLDAYDIEVIEGRGISTDFAADSSQSYMINETAARLLFLDDPVGADIQVLSGDYTMGKVVGVVKDFHYKSLHKAIEPLVIRYDPRNVWTVSIKFDQSDLQNNVALVEQEWKKIAPEHPFIFNFLDEDLKELYRSEQNAGSLITTFSLLAIIIACLGLFGLTSFVTEQRKKEIGVRKVLGASVAKIITLLGKDFIKLVSVAFLISVPLAFWAMNIWLEDFAYKIEVSPLFFIFAGFILLSIALGTVSYQSYKAATANPSQTLRE